MAKTKAPVFDYPLSVAYRSGCKVHWLYYESKTGAEKARKVAHAEAQHMASQGYDFGFCVPGEVRLMEGQTGEWAKYNGLYQVCCP